jgi:LDH2 family malate/lactate/ureidoglycolate dehydrogenase
MGVQNSNHFGAAGYYAAKCVEKGFVAMICSNSGPTMTPFGGKDRVLGNSPWSVAVPGGNRHPDPVMFDMACSEVSRGKCETALREGAQVPLGWGVDKEGAPSTDPAGILFGGSLLPFGGAKGYCIALMVEVLSSMLAFASVGRGKRPGGAWGNTGHFFLLMDPARFGGLETYRESIDSYVEYIKGSAPAPGVGEIIVPGELEARAIRERTEKGMELDEVVAASLAEVARKLGLLGEEQSFRDLLEWAEA